MKRVSLSERFWTKVNRGNDCWLWTGYTRGGYGRFQITSRRSAEAHRVAYELAVGPIPAGLSLDHLCRNTLCVRPEHLEPVTHRENVLRGIGPTARQAQQTECIHGHPFDETNTYVRPHNKGRDCRVCIRARLKKSKAKRKVVA